ncbi:hypothetical protein [Burkholderia plantarii]|uniref:hypothetical protein n=1 Tax=Burkholderia plantarii TaxID=41899 RepID=UPI001495D8CF|nr:hypothetical protein [Burkholderia plantarii]GLZ20836.1 hypothetical protein Bpla01_43650 [Burkholderia plantarii]
MTRTPSGASIAAPGAATGAAPGAIAQAPSASPAALQNDAHATVRTTGIVGRSPSCPTDRADGPATPTRRDREKPDKANETPASRRRERFEFNMTKAPE